MQEENEKAIDDILGGWQTKLLQLDRRNSLLYFRGKSNSIIITDTNPDELFNDLTRASKGRAFPYVEKRALSQNELDENSDSSRDVIIPGDLKTDQEPKQLQRRLSALNRKDREWEEEQGVNVLFVAFGFLNWIDDDGEAGRAPLLLAPADLIRNSPRDPWRLHLEDEDLQVNETLKYKLQTLGIDLPEFEHENISSFMGEVKVAVSAKIDWDLMSMIALATFPFGKMAMWRDLESMKIDGIDHLLINALAGNVQALSSQTTQPGEWLSSDQNLSGGGLDDVLSTRDQFAILQADHSQLCAIENVRRGGNVVIHGPPGTGKSQTIANIIASLLGDGKKVLFVSEKTAALDVVKRRLDECDMGDFLLDLHSDRGRKASVYEQLARSMAAEQSEEYRFNHDQLQNMREKLNVVVRSLHEIRTPLGLSVFEIHGRFARLQHLERVEFAVQDISELTKEKFQRIIETCDRIKQRPTAFETMLTSPWRALRQDSWTIGLPDALREMSGRMQDLYRNCFRDLDVEAEWLGIPKPKNIDCADNLKVVSTHLSRAPGVPVAWLNVDSLRRLRGRAEELRKQQEEYWELLEKISSTLGSEPPELDYENLKSALTLKQHELDSIESGLGLNWSEKLCPLPHQVADSIKRSLEHLERVREALVPLGSGPLANLSLDTMPEVRMVAESLREILSVSSVPIGWTHSSGIQDARKMLNDARAESCALREVEELLFSDFDEAVVNSVSKEMMVRFRTDHQPFYRILTKSFRHDIRALRGCMRLPGALGVEDALKTIATALKVKDLRADWSDNLEQYTAGLGRAFNGHDTDWESLAADLNDVEAVVDKWTLGNEVLQPLLSEISLRDTVQSHLAILELAIDDVMDDKLLVCRKGMFSQSTGSETEQTDEFETLSDTVGSMTVALAVVERLIETGQTLWSSILNPPSNWDELSAVLESAGKLRRIAAQEKALRPDLSQDFAHFYNQLTTDWAGIFSAIDWTHTLLNYTDGKVRSGVLSEHCNSPQSVDVYEACGQRIGRIQNDFTLQVEELDKLIDPALTSWDKWDKVTLSEVDSWLVWIQEHANSAGEWFEYESAKRDLEECIGIGVLELLRTVTVDATSIPNLVLRRVYECWLDAQYRADSRLSFAPRDHDLLRDEFKKLDKHFQDTNRSRVREKIFAKYPAAGAAFLGQTGKLRRQLEKRRNRWSVRKLGQEIPQLLQVLKPCFLMSPVAVSQYLPRDGLATDTIKFDTVIFDEASQVLPEDAVPALARAEQAVVVGDQQQLPPTNFFKGDSDGQDIDEEDSNFLAGMESFLDVMVAMDGSGVSRSYLDIHYRSRHEDLIRYSNHLFYDDRLLTFPSPERATFGLGIEDVYLPDARYDAGGKRTNRVEAEEVVRRVFHIMNSTPTGQSVGVVTLSRPQADLIEELINIRRLEDTSVESRFDLELSERFFVKNLENVQGDERDHILLSIGYGPTVGSGAVTNRFGPINQEGGHRRLNVAVSRAKRSFTLIRSIRPDQITSETDGARLLRRYIEFAMNPEKAFESEIDDDPARETESPFEESVCRALENRGFKVSKQVGVFGYRIDLAIRSEDDARFDLGIECDGATYHSAPAARDRDWLRQEVLEGLGWRIHRIWSTDWIKDPEGQVEVVESALNKARLIASESETLGNELVVPENQRDIQNSTENLKDPEVERSYQSVEFEDQTTSQVFHFTPYKSIDVDEGSRSGEIHEENPSRLQDWVNLIVRVEGPVHSEQIIDSIRRIYGKKRAGRQIRDTIYANIKKLVNIKKIRRVDRRNEFYVLVDSLDQIVPRGPAETVRSIKHICAREIEAGLLQITKAAYGIERADLIVATARAFGFNRAGAEIREALNRGISRLLRESKLEKSENGELRFP